MTPGKNGLGRPKYGLCRAGTEPEDTAAWRWLENNGLTCPGPGCRAGNNGDKGGPVSKGLPRDINWDTVNGGYQPSELEIL